MNEQQQAESHHQLFSNVIKKKKSERKKINPEIRTSGCSDQEKKNDLGGGLNKNTIILAA